MKYVGYIERFEDELGRMLKGPATAEAIVKWASDRVFESYRNGVDVGKNAKQGVSKRQEKSLPQGK